MLAGDADVAIEVLQETADLWLSRREETPMLAETRRNNDLYESNEAKLERQYKGSFILILTLSSTEVGRFSGHSRRLHGSHTTRVLGAVNGAPVSHSSFLLGARLLNSSLRGFTSPSAGTVSSSDTLTQPLSTILFRHER